MLSHQGVELFGRIRMIRRCGLVGGRVSLGVIFEVPKVHAKSSISASGSGCSSQLMFHCHVSCHARAMMIMA